MLFKIPKYLVGPENWDENWIYMYERPNVSMVV